VLIAMGANLGLVGFSYVVQTFVLAYASGFLGLPSTVGLVGVLLGAAIGAVTMPMFGAVADRIGPRPVIMSGAAFSAVFAFPFFWLLDTKVMVLVWLAIIVGLGVCVASMFGPIAAFYTGLFPTRYRYSGLVFARETTGAVIGGPTPLIATALLAWAGSPWPVAVYMIVTVVIPFVAVAASDVPGPERKASRPATDDRGAVGDKVEPDGRHV
jgi:MHS family shikimate/dehydroshikimate transporter-like MFS transporter